MCLTQFGRIHERLPCRYSYCKHTDSKTKSRHTLLPAAQNTNKYPIAGVRAINIISSYKLDTSIPTPRANKTLYSSTCTPHSTRCTPRRIHTYPTKSRPAMNQHPSFSHSCLLLAMAHHFQAQNVGTRIPPQPAAFCVYHRLLQSTAAFRRVCVAGAATGPVGAGRGGGGRNERRMGTKNSSLVVCCLCTPKACTDQKGHKRSGVENGGR